eukprot:4640082-Amphidinium_carterae.1
MNVANNILWRSKHDGRVPYVKTGRDELEDTIVHVCITKILPSVTIGSSTSMLLQPADLYQDHVMAVHVVSVPSRLSTKHM